MPRLLALEWPEDFHAIRQPSDRRHAFKMIARLRRHPHYGRKLHDGAGRFTREGLSQCRRLRGPKGTRIVYRVLPDDEHPIAIEVIAIRSRDDVYEVAAARMKAKRAA